MKLNRVIAVALSAAVLAMTFLLAGCSGEKNIELNQKTDGTSSIVLVNGTDQAVSSVAIKAVTDAEFGKNLLADGAAWDAKKKAQLFYNDAVDVAITLGDTVYTLHGMNLANVKEATLAIEGDLAYLTYKADGKDASTLEDEKAWTASEEARIAAEEAARIAAEEEAARQAEEESAAEAAQQTYSYSGGGSSSGNGGGSSAPAQSQESCIDTSQLVFRK